MLDKTNSTKTSKKAPGPGAIKKTDWQPLAKQYLQDRKVILHTDSARSYKTRVPGVLHDSVVHCKKRVKVQGKWVGKKPNYTKIVIHKLADGRKLKVKAGLR